VRRQGEATDQGKANAAAIEQADNLLELSPQA
jgi:hypothetical protein